MCIYWSMLYGCGHPKGKEEEPTADWTCEANCPYYLDDGNEEYPIEERE